MNRGPLFFGATLLALTAGWAAERLYASRGTPQGTASGIRAETDSALATPSRGAGELPEVGAAPVEEMLAPPSAIPAHLPEFTLDDRNGKPTSSAVWRGKSLVLNFWATWCAPCRREIPLLQSLARDWQTQDVAVVGVAVDHRAEVLNFAVKFGIGYPLLIGEQDALDLASALGLQSPVFPFTVFTDRRGEIVALFVGELHRAQAELILRVVRDLNQDRLKLADARHLIADGLRALPRAAAG